jgi:TolA-binding protein
VDGELEGHVRPQAVLRLGETRTLVGAWTQAEETFRSFLGTYPDSEYKRRATLWLGWSLENQQNYPAARAIYGELVESGRRDAIAARAQFQIGECLFAEGSLEDALRALVRVDALYGHAEWTSRALLEMGHVLLRLDRASEARERFEEVAERFPERTEATAAREVLREVYAISWDR